MLSDIDLLVQGCAKDLRGHSHKVHGGARLENPACVFYYGQRSARFYPGLSANLKLNWGSNAEAILHFVAPSPEHSLLLSPETQSELGEEELKAQLTGLLHNDKKFETATQITLYAVFDTRQAEDDAQFAAWYSYLSQLGRTMNITENLRSMLILITDQELGQSDKVRAIKKALHDLYAGDGIDEAGRHWYDSVFVLSNRRSDGTFAFFDAEREDYAADRMLSNLILLSNHSGHQYQPARQRLWNKGIPAYTVAYNYKEKPIREIVLAVLQKVTASLGDSVAVRNAYASQPAQPLLNAEALAEAIGMKNQLAAAESFWKSVEHSLPDNSFLAYLPNARTLRPEDSYNRWNQETLHCLEAFLRENHRRSIHNELDSQLPEEQRQIQTVLAKRFLSPELRRGVSPDVMREFRSAALRFYPCDGTQPVALAIRNRCKQLYVEAYCCRMEQALETAKQQAEHLMNEFTSIKTEIQARAAAEFYEMNDDVRRYYEDKAMSYLSGANRLQQLRRDVFDLGQTRQGILDTLRRFLSRLFAEDAVFQQPYLEELSTRLGTRAAEKQEEVTRELMGNLGDKLSFYFQSALPIKHLLLEAYLFSKTGEGPLHRLLSERESAMGAEKILHNTSNGDCVESIWVYALEKDGLLEDV